MSTPPLSQPTQLILSNKTWITELTAELCRLGHDQKQAERSAKNVLMAIVERAGWATTSYIVAERDLEPEL